MDGYPGVTFHKGSGKYQAQIANRGKSRYLGLFDTPEEAAAKFHEAAVARGPVVLNRFNPEADPLLFCDVCGKQLVRRRRASGLLEDRASLFKRKRCSRPCIRAGRQRDGLARSKNRQVLLRHARKHLKAGCERCGRSDIRLDIHHKNRDWRDNEPSNLETLCVSCHAKEHAADRLAAIRRKRAA
jgi:hypothetical protein